MLNELTDRHSQFVTLDSGLSICYAIFGAEHGTPLLYFHGWPSSRLQARTLDAIGKKLGLTIYAPDRPGVGRSDNDKNRKLKDFPKTIAEFLSKLNITERFYLMGVSGGGPYALATACALDHQIISSSIVCGAPPLAEFKNTQGMNATYRLLLQLRPIMPALIKPALPITKWVASKTYQDAPLSWFVKTLAPADQEIFLADKATVFALDSFREALINNAPGLILDADAYSCLWDFNYQNIKHPVHFWHGTADKNLPFHMAQYMASQVPNAITHWLEGEGHYTVPIQYNKEIISAAMG